MKDEKDLKLVNIYIRIHNKQVITMDDLAYLAKYNPVCFKKTCDNLIYKVPEAKVLVQSHEETPVTEKKQDNAAEGERTPFEAVADEKLRSERMIHRIIERLKKIESGEADALQTIETRQVKELLGGLFMESLFPHSGIQEYFDVAEEATGSKFNVRV